MVLLSTYCGLVEAIGYWNATANASTRRLSTTTVIFVIMRWSMLPGGG